MTAVGTTAYDRALERHISDVASDCEAWRRAGNIERYVQAREVVEALTKERAVRLAESRSRVLAGPSTVQGRAAKQARRRTHAG